MLNVLFLNDIVFTSFCLQPSELNDIFNFVDTPPPIASFVIWKKRGHKIVWQMVTSILGDSLL
jgi:hypothetical protein